MKNNKINKGLKIIALFIWLFIVNIIFIKLVDYIGFKIDNTSIYFISPAIATIILVLIDKYLRKNK